MVKCPECGKNNNDNDLFCGNCGSKMPEPKICPYCEYESFDNTYCTKCGEKLISNESFHIKKLKDKIELAEGEYNFRLVDYYCDKLIELTPDDTWAYEKKLYSLDRNEAMRSANKLLELDPDNINANNIKPSISKFRPI